MSVYSIASRVNSIEYDIFSKAPLKNPAFTGTVTGITKAMVGLGNVDNTSDDNKPVPLAWQNALNAKADISTTYTKDDVNNGLNQK